MKIPFVRSTGQMIREVYNSEEHSRIDELYPESAYFEWRENYTFNAILSFNGFKRFGKSIYSIWKDSNDRQYYMSLYELAPIIQNIGIQGGGQLGGKWTFSKKGIAYSIHLLETMTYEEITNG